MKQNLVPTQIKTSAAHDLLNCLDRYLSDRPLHENEQLHFENVPLKEYALQSAFLKPRTALHKVLADLAYVEFYLYPYDDVHCWDEFSKYVRWMFAEMGMIVPNEFFSSNPNTLRCARDKYRKEFEYGLHNIVVSAFAIAWQRRTLMCEFNKKLAEEIISLKKSDYSVLISDGRLPRCTFFPKWIWNRIVHRDRGQCQNCGRMTVAVYDSVETPHIDHMVPLASGGGNDPTNLQLLCGACNLAKGAKLVDIRDEYSWPNSRG